MRTLGDSAGILCQRASRTRCAITMRAATTVGPAPGRRYCSWWAWPMHGWYARQTTAISFSRAMPGPEPSERRFGSTESRIPGAVDLDCHGWDGIHQLRRRRLYGAARARVLGYNEQGYRGDYYLLDAGKVTETLWTPNRLSYEVNANEPTSLVINQTYVSWMAFGARRWVGLSGKWTNRGARSIRPPEDRIGIYSASHHRGMQ